MLYITLFYVRIVLLATFQVNIGRLKNWTSFSNMPKQVIGKAMEDSPEYEWDIYQPTPIMSTYTLGMAVANDYKYSETSTPNRKDRKIRAWIRSSIQILSYSENNTMGWKNITEENVDNTQKFLVFYEKYLNITDPVPKMDSIDIIEAWHGGMENWGVLFYPGYTELTRELTIAHETAHSWFGNLVTCKNWAEYVYTLFVIMQKLKCLILYI